MVFYSYPIQLRSQVLITALALIALISSGCSSGGLQEDGGPGRDGGISRDSGSVDSGQADMQVDACVPESDEEVCRTDDTDLNNDLCGGRHNRCGDLVLCGSCEELGQAGKVCHWDDHLCVAPVFTDEDLKLELGVTCGFVFDSCGNLRDIGGCTTQDEICNPNSNQCEPCPFDPDVPADVTAACFSRGLQCGEKWLGCGPRELLLDCGTTACAADEKCNVVNNLCEPDPLKQPCTPPTNIIQYCADRGAECGFVSDGCGGFVDCSCGGDPGACNDTPPGGTCPAGGLDQDCERCAPGPGGEARYCGLGRQPGKCSVPAYPECAVLGFECGDIDSGCGTDPITGQNQISCGECPAEEECINHRCGCVPRGCSDLLAGQCGSQLDDGCNDMIGSDCGCPSGEVCDQPVLGELGNCVAERDCAFYGANGATGQPCSKNNNSANRIFDRGDGVMFACTCSGPGVCAVSGGGSLVANGEQGVCCTNNVTCENTSPWEAGCQVTNSCSGAKVDCCDGTEFCNGSNACQHKDDNCSADHGATGAVGAPCGTFPVGDGSNINCGCDAANFCNGSNVCQAKKTCADYTDGENGSQCTTSSVSGVFPDDAGGFLVCPCDAGGVCQGQTGSAPGTCCFNANPTCADTGGDCSGPGCDSQCRVTNSCTGSLTSCCAGSEFCSSGSCVPDWTCATNPVTPTNRTEGDPCSNGNSPSFPREPGDSTGRTCPCIGGQGSCSSYSGGATPGTTVTGSTVGSCCINDWNCGNQTWDANCRVKNKCTNANINCCNSSQFCSGGTTCEHKNDNCAADHGATGAIGSPCGTFPVGDGSNINCGCSTSGGRNNNMCVGGTCQCAPRTCGGDCRLGASASNFCGGSINCACTGGDYCQPSNGACCGTFQTFGQVCTGTNQQGDPCGQRSNGCDGNHNCGGCSTASPYTQAFCNGGTKLCDCTPLTRNQACGDQTAGFQPDGCNGLIDCGGG